MNDSPIPPPSRFNAAAYLLGLNAKRAGRIAYLDDTGTLSYGALDDRVRRCAAGLLRLGLRPEDRLLIALHDGIDFPVAFLGALYAGIVPVPVNTLLTADDYAYLLDDSRARALLVSAPLRPAFDRALAIAPASRGAIAVVVSAAGIEPDEAALVDGGQLTFASLLDAEPLAAAADTRADDIAFWLYSSGSTGRPKGTVHSHANLYWTGALYAEPVLGLRDGDVCFSAAKLFFAYGLGNALTFPLWVGATTVLMAERPTPSAVFRRWQRHGVTVFFGAPTGYAGMLAAPDLPVRGAVPLRLCSSAGEALPSEIGQRFERHFGVAIIDGIGSTEMLHIFLSNRPGDVRYGSTGKPVDGYQLELRDDDGRAVADGEVGDLFIKGPSAALMYWGDRARTQGTFQGAWTKSGDKYSRDADGYYTYAGRSDDMLKVSGVWVSPFEVESTLMQHPAVLEAAVIGAEDAEGLTKTKAFVVVKPGHATTDVELKAFVKERLAPYKYPRSFEFVDELPKTATGKIQRFRLRERERPGS